MKTTVTNAMSKDLVTIRNDESMDQAFRKMKGWGIRHLPVSDQNGRIVGILSDRDVQRAMRSQVTVDERVLAEQVEFPDGALARDYMSWPVLTVDVASDVRSAAGTMIRKKVSSVLIVDQQRPVGIVTAEDLLRVLIEVLDDAEPGARWSLRTLLKGATENLLPQA